MDVVSSVVEKVKGFSISSQNFVNSLVQRHQTSNSCNPVFVIQFLSTFSFIVYHAVVFLLLSFVVPSKIRY